MASLKQPIFFLLNELIMDEFTGQTALITGATRGIGKGISELFLKHGATVIGLYAGNKEAADNCIDEWQEYQDQIHLFQCDVADSQQVEQLYDTVEDRFDSIQILVNNAGIRRDALLALMAEDDWQRVIDINLSGTFHMCKRGVKLMLKNRYGRIVNITSPMARLGFAGQSNYAASKAGQIGMAVSLAKECARKKITVNCDSPGFIATELLDDLTDDQLKAYKSLIPMRRFGTVQEVAEAVLFLASAKASYITGSVLEVNGGI